MTPPLPDREARALAGPASPRIAPSPRRGATARGTFARVASFPLRRGGGVRYRIPAPATGYDTAVTRAVFALARGSESFGFGCVAGRGSRARAGRSPTKSGLPRIPGAPGHDVAGPARFGFEFASVSRQEREFLAKHGQRREFRHAPEFLQEYVVGTCCGSGDHGGSHPRST